MHHDASKPDVRVAFGPRADLDRASSLHRAIGGSGAHPILTNLQSVTSNTVSYGLALSSQTETNAVPDDLPFILLSDTLHGAAEKRDHRTTLQTARDLLRRTDDRTHVYVDVPPDALEDLPERAGVFVRITGDPSQFQTTLRSARSLDRPVAISLDAVDRDHLETLRNCLQKIDLKPDLIIPDADCLFAARQACDILVDDHDFSRELLHRVASERSTPPGTFDSIDDLVGSVRAAALGTDSDTSQTSSQKHTTTTDHSTAEPTARNTTMNETDSHNGEYDGQKDIAIVGIGAKMPKALSADDFWNNIKEGVYAIRETPKDRWDPELYYDPDPEAPDKTYSKIGGWITDFEFDRKYYRIPPFTVQSMDESQLLAMDTTREALEDAGYLEDDDFDGQNCATILGNTLGGDLRDWTNLRIQYPEFEMTARRLLNSEFSGRLSQSDINNFLNTLEDEFKSRFNSIDEDSMPGELPNVIAGRVANAFNLRGPNFVTDAACASSLASVEQAVRGLRMNQFDTAVTGGVDRFMGPSAFVKFCKIGALSPDGSRPFDENANGFVMGEGCGVLVLKRLRDAVEDDDDIIALIRGCGSASDGAGKGITAPNPKGQKLAVRRAYDDAGYGPRSISLYEAHGTSTPIGDPTEFKSTYGVVSEDGGPAATNSIAMGSVKSMIGHLKAGAGAASLIKVASALREHTLPPTLNVETPHPELNIDDTCFHIQQDTEQWSLDSDLPRRAGISAFGFGGTDYHMTLEEWDPSRWSDGKTRQSTTSTGTSSSTNATGGTRSTSSQPKTEQSQSHATDQVPRNSTDSTTTDTTQNIDRHDSGDTVDVEPNIAAKTGERPSRDEILERMTEVLCEQTGYDPAEIETDFELEADLGVDTVKQAEILAEVREEYGLAKDEDFRFSDYPTLERLADYVEERFEAGAFADQTDTDATAESSDDTGTTTDQNREQSRQDAADQVPRNSTDSSTTSTPTPDRPSREEILERMTEVLCEQTGYDPAEIETDFELEADLGVDTVKQAEILAEVREEYGLAKDDDFRFSDYPTLERLADYVEERFEAGAFTDQPDTDTQADSGDATGPATDQNHKQSQPDAANQVPRETSERPPKSTDLTQGLIAFTGNSEQEVADDFRSFKAAYERSGLDATREHRVDLEEHSQRDDIAIPDGNVRLALAYGSVEELEKQLDRTAGAFGPDGSSWRILQNQGVYFADDVASGRIAMQFPGQGTQYLGMLSDLKEKYSVVQRIFDRADEVMRPVINENLSDVIDPDEWTDEAETKLRQTEYTQPAVLTADIALLKLIGEFGIEPDVVSGHSLGEYGALVAAGVMSFEDALRTVARRGTAMAEATPMNGDCGLMASIPAGPDEVQRRLEEIDGYVVCANKNCPKQTIIAGLSEPVEQAVDMFEDDGYMVQYLNVSHAFHTKVVAEGSKPLREHLESMDINPPKIPVLSNVTGDYHPTDPDEIRDLMAEQVASPVEWMSQVRRMHEDGARIFIEVGPKSALTTFISSILQGEDVISTKTNHPKDGGVPSLLRAMGRLWAEGVWTDRHRAAEAYKGPSLRTDEPVGIEEASPEPTPTSDATQLPTGARPSRDEILERMTEVLCEQTGYDPAEIETDFELEADLGVDTVKQAEILAEVREEYGLAKDEDFRFSDYPTLERLADYVEDRFEAGAFADQTDTEPTAESGDDTGPTTDQNQQQSQPDAADAVDQVPRNDDRPSREEILERMTEVLCEQTGYDPAEIETDFELEADLGVDTVKQAEILAEVREEYGFAKDEDFRFSDYPTLERLADYVEDRFEAGAFADQTDTEPTAESGDDTGPTTDQNQKQTQQDAADQVPRNDGKSTPASAHQRDINPHDTRADIVVSGGSLGLPGADDVFSDDTVDRLLDGDNFIGELDEEDRKRIVSKQITRLRKHEGGGGELEEVTDTDEVVKLAARAGSFDFDDWGVPKRLAEALDHTSRLAFAAGIEALRDAGLPLVPKYRETQSGKKLTEGWKLPDKVGDETGIIFASAFAGQDAFADELEAYYTDEGYEFNHRLLLRMLGMANARFAEYVGARGPNTKINNACASTTTAIGMAHDWIAQDRCERVVILSADDATSDTMMEWVGSGFLATGAATTESEVEDAALPFDKRRNGMIVGMGAVGLVVEEDGLPEQRGLEPIADVLSTHFVNSGHHPTRLDVDHIAGQVDEMLSRTEEDFDLDRHDIADKTVFVSHETYTPARGGSADAEIESIRRNFGDDAERIVIANTKGYTGHAQGASIEEMLAVKALQHRRIPAIANFEVPDPNLGNLRLSEGGDYDVDYALRLAAGFGSQLALVMYRFRARQQDRVFDERRREAWLREATGMEQPNLHVEDRTLRVKEGKPDDHPTPPSGGSSDNEAPSNEPTSEKPTTEPETDTTQPTVVTSDSSGHPSVKAEEVAPDYLQADVDDDERNRFKTEAVLVEADTSAAYDPLELKNRLEGKRIVIFAGPMLVTNLMRRAAERCGADVLVLEDSSRRSPLESDETVCNLKDEQAIREEFDSFGPVDGVINLLGFGREDDSPEDVHTVARQTFHVARAWRNHLGENPGADQFMTSVTGMGGRLGFDRATSPLPVCGAVCGLTKGLAREWPEANVRVVDVARDGLYPDLCQQILAETFSDVRSLEVGLLGGVRYLPVAVDADEIIGHGAGTSKAPTADSVILITGGAKGITSRIGMDLARRFNCKLALVGRTELTFDDPLSIDMDEAKAEAKRRIEERGERVTPVKVRDELYPLKSQRTIRENMNAMTDLGADVSYFSCDVSDRKNVTDLIDRVRQHFGRIDGVIHAAGVEDSKLIHDKDPAAFDKVFNAKAIGGLYLWDAVAEFSPDFFVTFSSVVARFGNAGQADYAGANEVLNKLVAQINATSDVHGLSIDWTAWEDVGMAAGGSVETILRRNGVEFLPPAIGAPILGDALEQGLSGECMVAADLGKLSEGFDLRRSEFSETAGQKEPHRPAFQGKVVEETTNPDRIVVERVFDPERDRFLEDHVYEGQPVLPGVMGVEMMVEVAEQLADDQATNVLDVTFDRAVKLHRGDPIRVIATAERIDENQVSVTLGSEREAKTGRMIERDHFTATVVFGAERRDSEPTPILLDDTSPYDAGFDRPDIYRRFFHTGSFQVIESVAHLNDDVVIAYGRKPTDRAFKNRVDGDLISDPMVREMAFQTAGIWGMVYNRQSYLPYAIGETTQYGTAEPGETVCIRARRRHDAEAPSPEISVISFDLEVRGDDGRLLQLHKDCQMVGHRNLDESECFPSPDTRRMTLRRMSRPEADALLADQGLEPNDVLTRQEQQDWKRLRSERRRGEWLAARIAAKDLACRYVLEFQGVRPQLEQVEVVKDDNGAPHLSWVDAPSDELKDVELPNVTVTHAEGVAIAAIAAPGTPCRVGVDLESIEKRSDGFADNYFTEVEQNLEFLVDGEAVDRSAKLTALWSIKEAVSKALGLGLKLALGEIVIEELRTADGYAVARVTLNGKAREEAERLRATNLDVHVRVDGGFALASARLAVDASADADKPSRPSKKERGDGKTPKESGNGHEPAVQNSEAKPRHSEFAAVAALLKHKGLLDAERNPAPTTDDGGEKADRSLPSWRS